MAASETYAEALGSEKRKKLPSSLRRDESLKLEELFCKRTLDKLQSYSRLTGIVCGLGYFSRWSICILTAIS